MKQKDIALILIIVIISAVISFIASGALFGGDSKKQEAEVVQPIVSSFDAPNKDYFNKESINPTKSITIEQSNNAAPFQDDSQSN